MKKKFKNISFLLLMIVLLPSLSGCNNEDDVIGIFTGKTWKLTFIAAEGTRKQFNFWGEAGMNPGNKAYTNSMDALSNDETFRLNFEGTDLNGTTGGSFNGRGITSSVSGFWNANGESHELKIKLDSKSSEKDVLAKAFITGLENAFKYDGDEKNLYIYYKEGQTTKFMAFHLFTPQKP